MCIDIIDQIFFLLDYSRIKWTRRLHLKKFSNKQTTTFIFYTVNFINCPQEVEFFVNAVLKPYLRGKRHILAYQQSGVVTVDNAPAHDISRRIHWTCHTACTAPAQLDHSSATRRRTRHMSHSWYRHAPQHTPCAHLNYYARRGANTFLHCWPYEKPNAVNKGC